MDRTADFRTAPVVARPEARVVPRDVAHEAYQLLHFVFTIAPIIAGLDKFVDLLVNWDQYLAPVIAGNLPIQSLGSTPAMAVHHFMMIVGVIEVIAGLIVAFRPRIGAYIVTLWLWGIIVNLLLVPGYFDIALRDFGLSLASLALARLSVRFD